jgi:hypothetical protein
MKALILAHKVAVLPQVREILNRYPVRQLAFVYPTEGGRMSEPIIRECTSDWLGQRSVEFHAFDFFTERPQFYELARKGEWDLVAIPFVGGRAYYRLRYWCAKSVKFIVISDGTCECSSLMDFYRRIRIKRPSDYLKILVMAAEMACLARAEEAYSVFYPLRSCFAKVVYPATPLPVSSAKAEQIRRLAPSPGDVSYVVQGYGIAFEDVVRKFHLVNAVTTVKRPLNSQAFFTGEELVDVLRPKRVIGYCCEVLLYAKKFYPKTECIAIMDPATDRKWGLHHNAIYRKQAARIGDVRFMSYEEYLAL